MLKSMKKIYGHHADLAQFRGTQSGFHPTALSVFTFFSDFQLFRPEHH
jgi:hypothetical protein